MLGTLEISRRVARFDKLYILVYRNSHLVKMSGDQQTSIGDKTLYKWNLGACILHFVQGTLLFIASFTAPGVKDFDKDITTNWLDYDEETNSLVNETETIGTIKIGTVVSFFAIILTQFIRFLSSYA